MLHHVIVRSQPARTGKRGFHGPDTYVAVVSVPEGIAFNPASTPLQTARLEAKGIRVEYMGEGYGQHSGSRSALGQAIASAQARVRDLQGVVAA